MTKDVIEDDGRTVQHIVIPIPQNDKAFSRQNCVSRFVLGGVRMLASVDFDDDALIKANKIENKAFDGHLPAKLSF